MDSKLVTGPATLPLVMAVTFAATAWIVLVLTTPYQSPAVRLARYARLTGRRGSPGAEAEFLTFRERLIYPLFKSLLEFAARAAPSRARSSVAAELTMAGSRMSPSMFLGLQTLLMLGMPALGVLNAIGSGALDLHSGVVLALTLIWGRRLPTMWLRRRIRSRQRAIDRALPYSVDLMVACLEGGLSIEGALAKVVEQTDGPMAFEVRKTLQELSLGRPTAEALRDLGERTGAPGLKRLTEDVVQADRMGISIAESMRTLAHEARVLRRQQAEESARKAPIKMVPVLIFCVLPALGIVTMAPAAILLIRTLGQSTAP